MRSTSRVRTAGVEQTSATGSTASSTHPTGEPASRSTGTPVSPTTRALESESPIHARDAVKVRARGTPARRPSSIWITTDQTLPGRYLPSCPTRKIRPASTGRSGCPSSREQGPPGHHRAQAAGDHPGERQQHARPRQGGGSPG